MPFTKYIIVLKKKLFSNVSLINLKWNNEGIKLDIYVLEYSSCLLIIFIIREQKFNFLACWFYLALNNQQIVFLL